MQRGEMAVASCTESHTEGKGWRYEGKKTEGWEKEGKIQKANGTRETKRQSAAWYTRLPAQQDKGRLEKEKEEKR